MGTPVRRRTLFKVAAAGAGAAVASGALGRFGALAAYGEVPALAGKTAIVVGSGFSGAVAALRLGQAGVHTTVLERGRRWEVKPSGDTFCTIKSPDWRCAWFNDRPPLGLDINKKIERKAGLIATHEGEGIRVLSGSGVGGGSLVIGLYMPQPRRAEWDKVYPSQLPFDEMDRTYWPRARENLKVGYLPADVQAHPQYRGARAWLEYLAEFGKEPVPIPFAVDWNAIREELAGKRVACHSIGEGPFGSNSGAKNSVDRTYLARATATGNVTILAQHEVTEIREVAGRYEVVVKLTNDNGDVLSTKKMDADYLFLAAGSVYSSGLMVTAKAKGWLPKLNAATGKGWGNNGDFLVLRMSLRKDVGFDQGGPGNVKFFDEANPFAPTSMAWEAAPVPNILNQANSTHLITSVTPERGEVRYDPATGGGKVHWPYGVMETLGEKAGRDLATRFWWETEGKKGFPFNGLPNYDRGTAHGLGARNTYHPLGGLVMGQATEFSGQVKGYPGLYCVDGALLPGSTCLANPSLTITANAERCLDVFLANAIRGEQR